MKHCNSSASCATTKTGCLENEGPKNQKQRPLENEDPLGNRIELINGLWFTFKFPMWWKNFTSSQVPDLLVASPNIFYDHTITPRV